MEAVLRAQQLSKTYGKGRHRVPALQGVEFDVSAGRVTGLIGPNGAGKSTFLKLALGFLRPTGGSVDVFGHAPGALPALSRLGFLPENPSFPQHLRGREFLAYCGRLLGLHGADLYDRIEELLDEVGITHAANRFIRGYSKGMRQRLGLAQALLGSPQLLILDEPMSGLDPLGRAAVKRMLRTRAEAGTSILFCSHILEDVERLCDEVLMLVGGRLRFRGSVAELFALADPVWTVVVQADRSVLDRLPEIHWRAVGAGLWSAVGLAAEEVKLLHRIAAEGRITVQRLERSVGDLEDQFLRWTDPAGAADA